MPAIRRCGLAAVLLCIGVLAARAQGDVQSGVIEHQFQVASGRDVRVGIFTDIRPDCTPGPLPAIRLAAAPAHGTVIVKRATLKATNLKQCLAVEVPAFVAFYRAAADFSGADVFELEIGMQDGRKRHERVQVNVTKSPGVDRGI
jgi:hypothetical protein